MSDFDVAIIGAGIAGAGLAAAIGDRARVLLLEAEDAPGYHSTGRSAAFWSETYGGPGVQPLTSASEAELRPFLDPLGSLHLAHDTDAALVDGFLADFQDSGVALELVDPRDRIPGLRPGWTRAIFEPSCAYIDVAGLHGAMLKAARVAGAELRTRAAVTGLARTGSGWRVETREGVATAPVVVNAAGAWAQQIAEMAGAAPIAIAPYRRTMVQLRTMPEPLAGMPHVTDMAQNFYFKPEAGGRLWLSPHDEIPSAAVDAAPEEIDVAIAIDRFEQVVDWKVAGIERKWAGLRSFAPDRLPVYGFDLSATGFFWCAGQGGFGIQTAPAASRLAAALLLGDVPAIPGVEPARYRPERFA